MARLKVNKTPPKPRARQQPQIHSESIDGFACRKAFAKSRALAAGGSVPARQSRQGNAAAARTAPEPTAATAASRSEGVPCRKAFAKSRALAAVGSVPARQSRQGNAAAARTAPEPTAATAASTRNPTPDQ